MSQREVKEICVEFAFVGRSVWRELAMKRGTPEAMRAAELMEDAVNSVIVDHPGDKQAELKLPPHHEEAA